MKSFFKKWFVLCILFTSTESALSYSCVIGGVGHCIWGELDKKHSKNINLIDPKLFLTFCEKYEIHCSAYDNGYNAVIGRNLNNELFIIAGKGWGGPDLILENQSQAKQFAKDFKNISSRPNTYYYVKNDSDSSRKAVVIGYKEQSDGGHEEIKLLMLPNQWEDSGDNHLYVPPDM